MSTRYKVVPIITALLMVIGISLGSAASASALTFDAGNSASMGGTTYRAEAHSCFAFTPWSGCDWSSSVSVNKSQSFTHRTEVKANGLNCSISIGKSAAFTISGNSSSLVTLTKSTSGTKYSMSGHASPNAFTLSIAARSTFVSGGSAKVSSGWTTW